MVATEGDFNWITYNQFPPVVTGFSDSQSQKTVVDASEAVSLCCVNQIVDLHHENGPSV